MKKNNGITLITLVITIIVLLILVGIAISMLTGDNGMLLKATTANETTKKASAEEKVKIAVAGSYNTNGKINIDDLNRNLENIEGIDKSGLPITELPETVIVDGYTFLIEQNGKVELAGPRPVIGEIEVTLKDGSAIPEDRADDGTELKIEFTATIEGGTITSISPQIPYITNGTDKQVKFTITGTVDGVTYKTEKTIGLKRYYKGLTGVVKYDAGNWTKEEIAELQNRKLYDINLNKQINYVLIKVDYEESNNLTFGGFTYKEDVANKEYIQQGTIITSRNQSVAPQGGYGIPKYGGWQIYETTEKNGKEYVTKLIHAGCPENFTFNISINSEQNIR